ncbi:hypothetical protein RRG08_048261 [Elysia crispata]|uniref:Uncharacterized protein n=1 Tax=Elysia crispata TaxID=231223 RepID=A0AAE1DLG4_9GAST|nr:hypothetical protein RRG08_048261 [Elysia crispata]
MALCQQRLTSFARGSISYQDSISNISAGSLGQACRRQAVESGLAQLSEGRLTVAEFYYGGLALHLRHAG